MDLSVEYRQLQFELRRAVELEERSRAALEQLDTRRRAVDGVPVGNVEHSTLLAVWKAAHKWLADVSKRIRTNRELALHRFQEDLA
jgi:hypothetical protein